MNDNLKDFLDAKVSQYNRPEFIANDPVSIPHLFTQKQDIEIMGFWAATLAWGQRVTIIKKCKELIGLMDGAPYDFIINHEGPDLKKLLSFKHRTFNDIDTLYFISFFRYHYEQYDSLEDAFLPVGEVGDKLKVEVALNYFRSYFFSLPDFPHRTKKHVSSPSQKSTCKRLNMFLRWMVRKDDNGVDFGIWNNIKPADLICPCDLHVERVARKLRLITRKQTDWHTAAELTENLRKFDPLDPVKYDFALFGLGIEERWGLEGILPNLDLVMNDRQSWPVWATQPIVLESYDASWPQRANALVTELQSLYDFGEPVFEHIGSTSVPGLEAKPIIDLMLEVDGFDAVDQIEQALLPANWHMIPPVLDIRDRRRVFVKVVDNKRYAHLHIVTHESKEMARHLAFRDLLRSNPSIAQAYLQLKKELALKYRDDRDAYSNGKNDFIRDALNKNA